MMTIHSTARSRFRMGISDDRFADPLTARAKARRAPTLPLDVVVAGEHPERFESWSGVLRECGLSAVPTNTRLEAVLSALIQRRPAALVVDLSDLTRVGLELAQQIAIRDEFLALPILFLLPESARSLQNAGPGTPGWEPAANPFGLSAEARAALESILYSCSDFMFAPVTAFELGVRLVRLVRETQPAAPEERKTKAGPVEIDDRAHRVVAAGREVALRKKEYDLLLFLIRNAGVVFTRDALLRWVWGPGFTGDARTVDVHIRRLRSKLGREACRVIETVRRVGYRLSVPGETGGAVESAQRAG
jgi:DNA-binding response OmpR family regulator